MTPQYFLRMLEKETSDKFSPNWEHTVIRPPEAVVVAQNALKANDAAAKSADFLAAQPDPSDAIQQDFLRTCRFFLGTDGHLTKKREFVRFSKLQQEKGYVVFCSYSLLFCFNFFGGGNVFYLMGFIKTT